MPTHPLSRRLLWILIPLVIGCQHKPTVESGRTAAGGTVTLDGKPIPAGTVTLVSVKDPLFRVAAAIRQGGVFQVTDAPEGEVRVAVETETIRSIDRKSYVPIPAKYNDTATSGLKATVTRSDPPPPISIELKSR
jgi:hypothetical protein